ncbi:MAG: glycosyltransferase [Alistipes sp.]|nr:glycosyltransferase [Alistipes sp.]
MEQISYTIISFIENYGWFGVLLTAAAIIMAIADIVCLCRYGALTKFRLVRRPQILQEEPPVSVIVPMMSENNHYIDETLHLLLEQDKQNYEVVVVYVGNDTNFYADLEQLKQIYPHLHTSHISTAYPLTNKMVINVGIKAATNEHIIITTPEAAPDSNRWLSFMAKGFLYGDIVVGYSNWKVMAGWHNLFFRKYRFNEMVVWLNAAIRGNFIKASRNNLGFTKSLYLKVRGFNYLGYNVGEDDIFIKKIATSSNVSVLITPNARISESVVNNVGWWRDMVHRNGITRQFFTFGERLREDIELIIRSLFFTLFVAVMVLLPSTLQIVAAVAFALRYIIVSWQRSRMAHRLGEIRLHNWSILYDIIEPLVRLLIRITQPKRESEWR